MACSRSFCAGEWRFEFHRATYITKESVEGIACGISGRVNVWKVYHHDYVGLVYVKPTATRAVIVQAARSQLQAQL